MILAIESIPATVDFFWVIIAFAIGMSLGGSSDTCTRSHNPRCYEQHYPTTPSTKPWDGKIHVPGEE